jgi:hypothetical protein
MFCQILFIENILKNVFPTKILGKKQAWNSLWKLEKKTLDVDEYLIGNYVKIQTYLTEHRLLRLAVKYLTLNVELVPLVELGLKSIKQENVHRVTRV